MRPAPRPLLRRHHVLALVLIALCLAAIVIVTWPIHRLVLQGVALLLFLAALASSPQVSKWLRKMPTFHRAVFFLLVAGIIAGHFSLTKRTFFPFVAWGIFSAVSEQDPVLCRELIGTTAEGKSVRLLVEQLFPSIVQFDLPPQDKPMAMDHLVHAMARVYDQQHPADPLRQVDLMLMAVELNPPAQESRTEPSCELLQRYDISSDQ